MVFIALVLSLITSTADFTISPNPVVAGKTVTISVPGAPSGSTVTVASPMGKFRRNYEVTAERTEFTLIVPRDLPLLLLGTTEPGQAEGFYTLVDVVDPDGKTNAMGTFWKAYLLSGQPAPFKVQKSDMDTMALARSAIEEQPDYLVSTILLWRLEAVKAIEDGRQSAFLDELDARLAARPEGRLALGAALICRMLGQVDRATGIETRYAETIGPINQAETERWNKIQSTRTPEARIAAIHQWLADDPLTGFTSLNIQLLAPSYQMIGDHRSTVRFGLMSLEVTPDDAMTLNGVAMAMAEGGFELERGLLLAERAYGILNRPGSLQKPEGLSQAQWQNLLTEANAATLDTRGLLLTKLERWDDAENIFDQALELMQKDEFYLHYGEMLHLKGDNGRAIRTLELGYRLAGPKRMDIKLLLDTLKQ